MSAPKPPGEAGPTTVPDGRRSAMEIMFWMMKNGLIKNPGNHGTKLRCLGLGDFLGEYGTYSDCKRGKGLMLKVLLLGFLGMVKVAEHPAIVRGLDLVVPIYDLRGRFHGYLAGGARNQLAVSAEACHMGCQQHRTIRVKWSIGSRNRLEAANQPLSWAAVGPL